jgi:hypothetical protein
LLHRAADVVDGRGRVGGGQYRGLGLLCRGRTLIRGRTGRRLREDLVRKDLVRKDLVRKDLVRKDLVRKDLVRKDLVRKDLGAPHHEHKYERLSSGKNHHAI